ncbi:MAG TPA: hypothetical protein VH723_05280 [Candidatus Limnocylindrales bacterium]|jgi:hypothetical protein
MIDQPRIETVTADPAEFARDERSMRLFEYALAMLALVAAILISFH